MEKTHGYFKHYLKTHGYLLAVSVTISLLHVNERIEKKVERAQP